MKRYLSGSIVALLLTLVTALVQGHRKVDYFVNCEEFGGPHGGVAPCVVFDEGDYRLVTSWNPYRFQRFQKANVTKLNDHVYMVTK